MVIRLQVLVGSTRSIVSAVQSSINKSIKKMSLLKKFFPGKPGKKSSVSKFFTTLSSEMAKKWENNLVKFFKKGDEKQEKETKLEDDQYPLAFTINNQQEIIGRTEDVVVIPKLEREFDLLLVSVIFPINSMKKINPSIVQIPCFNPKFSPIPSMILQIPQTIHPIRVLNWSKKWTFPIHCQATMATINAKRIKYLS